MSSETSILLKLIPEGGEKKQHKELDFHNFKPTALCKTATHLWSKDHVPFSSQIQMQNPWAGFANKM